MNRKTILHLACCLPLLLVYGCLSSRVPSSLLHQETVAFDQLQPTDFPKAITTLEQQVSRTATSPQAKAEAFRHLALLYLMPANPLRDESKAVATLRTAVKELPEGTARAENGLWLQLLEEKLALGKESLQLRKKTRQGLTAQEKEKQQLLKQVEDLSKTNAKLLEDIEKLKLIDLSVEKKRKSFR